jgi:hypothetical protein
MVQRRKNMTKQFRLADGNGGKAKSPGSSAWRRLVIAGGLCLGLAANFALAQVAEPRIWPTSGRSLWFWIEPKTDFLSEQVDAAFKKAVDEGMAFLDPAFSSSVFFAKHIRLTAGKARERKKYKDQPAKADDIRIETEWQTGDMNQYRGSSYCFIALNSVRSLDLHYLPNLRERFPKAPESRNWNVNILAGSLYNFFFGTEDAARNFINAVASLLKQRGINLTFSRFGLMWENVTPAQAADGIRPLDAILEVNGSRVKNFSHFSLLLDGMASGTKASLVLLRRLKDPDLYPEQNVWNTLTVEMEAR